MRFIKEKRPPKTVSVKEQKQPSIRLVRSLFIGITIYLMISGPLALHKVNLTQTQIQKEQETLTKEPKQQMLFLLIWSNNFCNHLFKYI